MPLAVVDARDARDGYHAIHVAAIDGRVGVVEPALRFDHRGPPFASRARHRATGDKKQGCFIGVTGKDGAEEDGEPPAGSAAIAFCDRPKRGRGKSGAALRAALKRKAWA
jgi:hypothetical protein